MQKHTTKRPPKQSAKTTRRTNTHAPAAATSPRETYYPSTTRTPSSKRHSNQLTTQEAHFVLKRFLSGKTLKKFRNAHNLSARELGLELGVSRAYIKQIEGGSKSASQKLIKRFDALRATMGEGTTAPAQEDTPRTVTVVSRFELPAHFEILAKPKRCKTCKKNFVPRTPQQKFCSRPCAKLAEQKRKAKQTKAKRGQRK